MLSVTSKNHKGDDSKSCHFVILNQKEVAFAYFMFYWSEIYKKKKQIQGPNSP